MDFQEKSSLERNFVNILHQLRSPARAVGPRWALSMRGCPAWRSLALAEPPGRSRFLPPHDSDMARCFLRAVLHDRGHVALSRGALLEDASEYNGAPCPTPDGARWCCGDMGCVPYL